MKVFPLICVNCGNEADRGSMKHPYCRECFKKVWNNDEGRFVKWMADVHEKA